MIKTVSKILILSLMVALFASCQTAQTTSDADRSPASALLPVEVAIKRMMTTNMAESAVATLKTGVFELASSRAAALGIKTELRSFEDMVRLPKSEQEALMNAVFNHPNFGSLGVPDSVRVQYQRASQAAVKRAVETQKIPDMIKNIDAKLAKTIESSPELQAAAQKLAATEALYPTEAMAAKNREILAAGAYAQSKGYPIMGQLCELQDPQAIDSLHRIVTATANDISKAGKLTTAQVGKLYQRNLASTLGLKGQDAINQRACALARICNIAPPSACPIK